MKKALLTCFLLAIFPIAASAATVEELRAQIEALLQQVTTLQQSTATQTTTTSSGQCPLISRNLKAGMSGEDVTRLQQFLARDRVIYPEGTVSGYYGALTEAAVKRFQCKHQIVCDGTPASTGYGVTGPRTAALLALQCSGGTAGGTSANVGGYISVTPTSGSAPLRVTIQATVNTTKSCTGATYELHYGDTTAPSIITVPNGGCGILSQSFSHTYTTSGTYIVRLRAGGHESSATVIVSGNAATSNTGTDTFAATPVSGSAPLNVSFTGKANATGSCSPQTYSVQFGDGTTANIPVSDCSISTYAITHGYNSNGNYTARFFRGSTEVKTVSITVGSGNAPTGSTQGGGSFTADLGYGGDVFSVLATFSLASSCTAYDINWGDGTPHATQATGSCGTGVVTKEISHTYSGNGTYTITLKRGTGSGETTDTVGVTVVY